MTANPIHASLVRQNFIDQCAFRLVRLRDSRFPRIGKKLDANNALNEIIDNVRA